MSDAALFAIGLGVGAVLTVAAQLAFVWSRGPGGSLTIRRLPTRGPTLTRADVQAKH